MKFQWNPCTLSQENFMHDIYNYTFFEGYQLVKFFTEHFDRLEFKIF